LSGTVVVWLTKKKKDDKINKSRLLNSFYHNHQQNGLQAAMPFTILEGCGGDREHYRAVKKIAH
jgi:hypothetical protein